MLRSALIFICVVLTAKALAENQSDQQKPGSRSNPRPHNEIQQQEQLSLQQENHICGQNEHFDRCGRVCEKTCETFDNPACQLSCNPAQCTCKQGYVRKNLRCVPAISCSNPNEQVFIQRQVEEQPSSEDDDQDPDDDQRAGFGPRSQCGNGLVTQLCIKGCKKGCNYLTESLRPACIKKCAKSVCRCDLNAVAYEAFEENEKNIERTNHRSSLLHDADQRVGLEPCKLPGNVVNSCYIDLVRTCRGLLPKFLQKGCIKDGAKYGCRCELEASTYQAFIQEKQSDLEINHRSSDIVLSNQRTDQPTENDQTWRTNEDPDNDDDDVYQRAIFGPKKQCGNSLVTQLCIKSCKTSCKALAQNLQPACIKTCVKTVCRCDLNALAYRTYVENENIPTIGHRVQQLNEELPVECLENEYFNQCGNHCEPKCNDTTPEKACDLMCRPPACHCKEDFYRNQFGQCVHRAWCRSVYPQTEVEEQQETLIGAEDQELIKQKKHRATVQQSQQQEQTLIDTVCQVNEFLNPCGNLCEVKCTEQEPKPCPRKICNPPTCQCKPGYYRSLAGECVTRDFCEPDQQRQNNFVVTQKNNPVNQQCREDEYLNECGNRCELTCEEIGQVKICDKACHPAACHCKQGLYRNQFGQCVQSAWCRAGQEQEQDDITNVEQEQNNNGDFQIKKPNSPKLVNKMRFNRHRTEQTA